MLWIKKTYLAAILVIVSLSQALGFNYQAFDQYVQKSLDDWGIAGAAIAIIEDGKITHIKCFGVKTAGGKKAVTPHTQFPIVSLTKAFSAFLLASLEQQGKLSWNDPVKKYLPDFKLKDPEATEQMTVAELFAQNSGLPMFAGDTLAEMGWSDEEIYHAFDQIVPVHAFRETFDYQNVFPGIAGMIATKVSGQTLSDLYQDTVFAPLDMADASMGENGITKGDGWFKRFKAWIKSWFADKVDEHYLKDGKSEKIQGDNPAIYRFPASRGLNASITDMAKWMSFWLNRTGPNGAKILDNQKLDHLWTKQTPVGAPEGGTLFPKERVKNISYGFGWYTHDYGSLPRVISHMGGMTGTRAIIVMVPEKKTGLVMLSNVGGMRVNLIPEGVRSKFLDMLTGEEEDRDWNKELMSNLKSRREKVLQERNTYRMKNLQPAHTLDMYVGEFENDLYGTATITKEGEKLYLTYRNCKAPLHHWNADGFTIEPQVFTRSLSATDFGDVTFGIRKGRAELMAISLFYEGKDPIFKRKG